MSDSPLPSHAAYGPAVVPPSRVTAVWLGVGIGATATLWTVLAVAVFTLQLGARAIVAGGLSVAVVLSLSLMYRIMAEQKFRAIQAMATHHQSVADATDRRIRDLQRDLDEHAGRTHSLLEQVSTKLSETYWLGYTTGIADRQPEAEGGDVLPFRGAGG